MTQDEQELLRFALDAHDPRIASAEVYREVVKALWPLIQLREQEARKISEQEILAMASAMNPWLTSAVLEGIRLASANRSAETIRDQVVSIIDTACVTCARAAAEVRSTKG